MNRAEAKMAAPRLRVRQSELAVMLGVSRQAVSRAFGSQSAPPFDGDGRIDAETALAWYATRGARGARAVAAYRDAQLRGNVVQGKSAPSAPAEIPPIEVSRRRQAYADAQLAELELAKARGMLVSRDDAERAAAEDGAAIRSGLLALPSQIAPALADAAAVGGATAVAALLDAELRRLLASWARVWRVDGGREAIAREGEP